MIIKIIFIVLFFACMLFVGALCRKKATDVDSFVLGGRAVGPWLSAFSFGTSYFSAVIFIGYAGRFGWNFGLASTWIGLGNALIGSLMAWMILGRRTRVMTQHLSSKTMPDFFGLRFNSKPLTLIASIIVFIFFIPYTASLFNGLSQLFASSFAGVEYSWWVIIMAVMTGIYVIVGGYLSSAINNFIQGIIMLVGIVAVVFAVIQDNGGLTSAIAELSKGIAITDGSTLNGAFTSFFGPDPLALLGVVILTSLGTWGLPQMVGKFYSIKDEGSIHKGTVISTLFALVVAGGCYFLGGFGRLYADKIALNANGAPKSFDSILPTMLDTLNSKLGIAGDVLIGLVLILVLSASMSTLSSLAITSSSTITLDFISKLKKKDMSEKAKLLVMRVLIAVSIIISALIAILMVKNTDLASKLYISDLMGISWGALAGCFLAPFLYGLFWKRTTKASVYASFISGLVIMLSEFTLTSILKIKFTNAFMAYFFNSAINAGMLAMIVGLIIVPLVSLITKKPDEKATEEIFSCYSRPTNAKAAEYLK